jgi:BASS family bile acid:Na+ symporter
MQLISRICLVASCPGGTASNVVTFLANADVALSVMMTTVSTFAAVVMTPLLTKTLVAAMVPVDAKALFVSTLQASFVVVSYVPKTLSF